ncbi:MAG: cysteine synthase family protein [Chloroflexota bacterium]|nr:cysteine synthase family protein [Chloroflexota bacterium]
MSSAGRAGAAHGLVDSIGNTPMVELRHLAPPGVRLFAKLEGANPTGSLKDRIARTMLDEALASGALLPGQTILEPSSGNTGISLAMIGGLRGHPVRIVMPDNTTRERVELLNLFGAEVIHSPGSEGSNGAIRLAQELSLADPSLFMPFQYANEANPLAHQQTTGPEILAAVPELDLFVSGLGTGGTLTGVGRFLRGSRPAARLVAAEPLPGELVQGLRSLEEGFVPPVLDATLLTDRYLVSNRDAITAMRRLLSEEGIFAGPSSGAVLHVALRAAADLEADTVVMLLADGGWKYLSLDLWSGGIERLADELEGTVLW